MEAGFFIDALSADESDPPGEVSTFWEMESPLASFPPDLITRAGEKPGSAPGSTFGTVATEAVESIATSGILATAATTIAHTILSLAAMVLRRPQMDPARKMYEVKLKGPMRPEWGRQLREAAPAPASYMPPFAYRILLSPAELERVRALDFVDAIGPYGIRETLGPAIAAQLRKRQDEPAAVSFEPLDLDLTVHYPSQINAIQSTIKETPGSEIVEIRVSSIHFRARLSLPAILALAGRDEVKSLEVHHRPVLFLDVCRAQIGVTGANFSPGPWDGAGELVGIVDSGIDPAHGDLSSAIESYKPISGATSTDLVGHGTHVAGIVAGSGAKSDGKIRGVAPGAKLTVVGIVDAAGNPIFPPDLTPYMTSAVADGAKIINLSAGRLQSNGLYDDWAQSLDAFVYDNPEILIVVAAGNEGTASKGYPDNQTVGSPATARNVITVGACGSVRSGFADSWGDYDPNRFPSPPVSLTSMAGNPSSPAALSSRGPTQDRILKPDVVAPGTFVLSAKAASGALQSVAPVPGGLSDYIFLHGSSMAAPFVSGCAAVLRQYLRSEMQTPSPSAALMKAIFCASAARGSQLRNPNLPMLDGYPDFDQGFGAVNLGAALPHRYNSKVRLTFVDVSNDSTDALASRQSDASHSVRSSRSYKFIVGEKADALRIVVTWTDFPGCGVQNVLLLDVKGPGVALVGNHEYGYGHFNNVFNTLKLAGIPYDTRSNVQTVSIAAPQPGTYYANVLAYNTHKADGRQGYSLCVCGALDSALVTA